MRNFNVLARAYLAIYLRRYESTFVRKYESTFVRKYLRRYFRTFVRKYEGMCTVDMWGRMSTTGVGPAGSVDRAEDTVGVVLCVLFEIVLAIYLEQL